MPLTLARSVDQLMTHPRLAPRLPLWTTTKGEACELLEVFPPPEPLGEPLSSDCSDLSPLAEIRRGEPRQKSVTTLIIMWW